MLILTIFRFYSLALSAPPMPFPHDPGFLFGKFFRLPLTFETLIITSLPLFAFHFCSQGGKELKAAQLVRVTSRGTCSSHIKKPPIWQFVCSYDLQTKTSYLTSQNLLFVHMESSKSSHLTNFAGIVLAIGLGYCWGDGDRPIDEVSHQIAFRLPPVFLTISI